MDYRGYDPLLSRMPMTALPVATITTGISLTDRFKQLQHQPTFADHRYNPNQDGYGIPEETRPHHYGIGQRAAYIPNPVTARNRQLALALAKSSSVFVNRGGIRRRLGVGGTNRSSLAFINRGGIQRRLGVGGTNQIRGQRGAGQNRGQRGAGQSRGQRSPGQSRGGQRGSGRSRGAGPGRGRGRGGNRIKSSQEAPANREALDEELDSYMSNSRAYLDRQLDDYMLKAKQAQAAATAGTAVVGDFNFGDTAMT